MRPREALKVPVTLTGLDPGEEAYVTVAAVDSASSTSPATSRRIRSRGSSASAASRGDPRPLGSLIDSLSATPRHHPHRRRSAGADGSTTVATQELVARYSGLLKVGPDGKATAEFAIPAFNGTVKGDGGRMVEGRRSDRRTPTLIVRDPVVVTGSLPRVMAPGDESRLRLDFDNVSARPAIMPSRSKRRAVSAGTVAPSVTLAEHAKATLEVPLANRRGRHRDAVAHRDGAERRAL